LEQAQFGSDARRATARRSLGIGLGDGAETGTALQERRLQPRCAAPAFPCRLRVGWAGTKNPLMDRPETRFAWRGDVALAYQTLGDGSPPLLYLQGWPSNVETELGPPEDGALPPRARTIAEARRDGHARNRMLGTRYSGGRLAAR